MFYSNSGQKNQHWAIALCQNIWWLKIDYDSFSNGFKAIGWVKNETELVKKIRNSKEY